MAFHRQILLLKKTIYFVRCLFICLLSGCDSCVSQPVGCIFIYSTNIVYVVFSYQERELRLFHSNIIGSLVRFAFFPFIIWILSVCRCFGLFLLFQYLSLQSAIDLIQTHSYFSVDVITGRRTTIYNLYIHYAIFHRAYLYIYIKKKLLSQRLAHSLFISL